MRAYFIELLKKELSCNKDIMVITADLGYKVFDIIRDEFGNQFYNIGSSEQALVDIGIGLALSGKIPILYSITPFLLYRPFESLRTYLNYEKIPVKLVGSGRNKDYAHDGISHWAEDDLSILTPLSNIRIFYPVDTNQLKNEFTSFLYGDFPAYLNLKK